MARSSTERRWCLIGAADLCAGLTNWRISYLMGLGEIRRRYSRSRLGQFWMTVSTGVLVAAVGVVWSVLWKVRISELMPFIAISQILWTLISGAIGEAPTAFVSAGPIFLNQGMSFSTAIYALVFRHFLVFLHNLPIAILTVVAFPVPFGIVSLLAIPGIVLVLLSLVWSTYAIAIICVRFRDLTQVVQSALLIAFFVTPIFWKPSQFPPDAQYFLALNPFADLLSVVRDPMMGDIPGPAEWVGALVFAIGGFVLTLPLIGLSQRRIIFWI